MSKPKVTGAGQRGTYVVTCDPADEAALERLTEALGTGQDVGAEAVVSVAVADLRAALEMLFVSLATIGGITGDSRSLLVVAAERQRQLCDEGFSPDADDRYVAGELALAAACYAEHASGRVGPTAGPPAQWPFPSEWWRPGEPDRDLAKAGALLIAEQDRLHRRAGGGGSH